MGNETCVFCNLAEDVTVICESPLSIAFYDKYPVSGGHCLIVPRWHISDYFELSEGEQQDIWKRANDCKTILVDRFHPDGFNVGLNNGVSAGQSVLHAHVHVTPRYVGDVEDS
jgi:diadenosine tetraphosphate (Ap4A) HIT family hydrolase